MTDSESREGEKVKTAKRLMHNPGEQEVSEESAEQWREQFMRDNAGRVATSRITIHFVCLCTERILTVREDKPVASCPVCRRRYNMTVMILEEEIVKGHEANNGQEQQLSNPS